MPHGYGGPPQVPVSVTVAKVLGVVYDPPLTVTALLALMGLDARKVAVERNEEIVARSAYAQTWLQPGDQLEIVHFIGGG